MAKKTGGQKTPSYGFAADAKGKGRKLDSYEDTIEPGTVDDFMFRRDQMMFNEADESDEEDIADVGEEVMAIPSRRRRNIEDEEEVDAEEDDEDIPLPKKRKDKAKEDISGKGRFGKPVVDSDDSADESGSGSGSGSGSDSEEEEGWGRQYYAMPSSRREKAGSEEYDAQREEDRELEEKEVKRLQRKARESLAAEDYGLDDEEEIPTHVVEQESAAPVPTPQTTDPSTLLRHMEVHEPVKLALAREWPLVVAKLEKTKRGMQKLEAEKEGQLHKGLGWLHYQTLVTYASTLAFYIHLAALPPASRPDLSSHPILQRLLELKKGLSDLENLDFDAASTDGDPLLPPGWNDDEDEDLNSDEEEAELRAIVAAKKELIAKMMANGQEGEDEDEEEWRREGLEDGELEALLREAEAEAAEEMSGGSKKDKKKGKKSKKAKRAAQEDEDEMDFGDGVDYGALLARLEAGGNDEAEAPKKKKKSKEKNDGASTSKSISASSNPSFQTLSEPTFFSNSSTNKRSRSAFEQDDNDESGDPSALLDADATDKAARKRSLAFHTAKIASTASRRAAAREKRMGGDEDVPYRDRQAARDAALRKQTRAAGADGSGADLDGREVTEEDMRRVREIRGDYDDDMDMDMDGGDGEALANDKEAGDYYDLVKRARTSSKAAKTAAHEEAMADRLASRLGDDEDGAEGGPRSLTRAIEKNRGLTPRRSKGGRNPRVKKRQAYEKAKQKVGSQRAVYKGGQASLGGRYAGEKTGISTAIKSAKF